MKGPTFLVAGAGRSGTTGLVEGLKTHPQVFVTQPKEPHYFALHGTRPSYTGPGDEETINRLAVTHRQAYLDLYPRHHDFLALGDGSVSTLYYYDRALPEIQALTPDVRVVIILREPVARAHSAFSYLTVRGFENCPSLLDAVADEDRRVATGWHHLWHYTRMSRYADSVAAFQSALGPERVGVWFYDDLHADYVGTVKQVLRFLDVPDHRAEAIGVPVVNASGQARSRLLQAGVRLATGNGTLRRTAKRLTTYRAREMVRRRMLSRTEVTRQERAALEPAFEDDLRELAGLVSTGRSPAWLARWARDV